MQNSFMINFLIQIGVLYAFFKTLFLLEKFGISHSSARRVNAEFQWRAGGKEAGGWGSATLATGVSSRI